MLGTALKATKWGWDQLPSPVKGFWLDVLFGREEPFEYKSVTCPDFSSP